jgi:hypothetical protein
MTDANGSLVVLNALIFLIRFKGVQDELGWPSLQTVLLCFHPGLGGLPGRGDGLGGCVEIIADREEVQ